MMIKLNSFKREGILLFHYYKYTQYIVFTSQPLMDSHIPNDNHKNSCQADGKNIFLSTKNSSIDSKTASVTQKQVKSELTQNKVKDGHINQNQGIDAQESDKLRQNKLLFAKLKELKDDLINENMQLKQYLKETHQRIRQANEKTHQLHRQILMCKRQLAEKQSLINKQDAIIHKMEQKIQPTPQFSHQQLNSQIIDSLLSELSQQCQQYLQQANHGLLGAVQSQLTLLYIAIMNKYGYSNQPRLRFQAHIWSEQEPQNRAIVSEANWLNFINGCEAKVQQKLLDVFLLFVDDFKDDKNLQTIEQKDESSEISEHVYQMEDSCKDSLDRI